MASHGLAGFPSVDLTDVDLVPLARTARRVTERTIETTVERSVDLARDVTYTAVGLGLLTFQRAQVRRRQLERALRR